MTDARGIRANFFFRATAGIWMLLLTLLSSHLAAEDADLSVSIDSFSCLSEMTPVRHFFVDNLLGDIDSTLQAANSAAGAPYPPGSVVQLIPTEAMVKHPPGWNAATRDWEFFELSVAETGTTIDKRGFADVVNLFGGNCFGCHVKARPEWDMICESGHGCDPVPFTREQVAAIQKADPRCL